MGTESHRFSEVRVELEHVVELLLEGSGPQGFEVIVLQEVCLGGGRFFINCSLLFTPEIGFP